MHVISRKALKDFWENNPEAEQPLVRWFSIADKARWQNLAQIKTDCPSADFVGKCVVFNVGGNKFRLIVKIEFLKQRIYIKDVLTHKQYDTNKWKDKC